MEPLLNLLVSFGVFFLVIYLFRKLSGTAFLGGGANAAGEAEPHGKVVVVASAQEFEELSRREACIVDFTATWCGPCRAIAPHFAQLSLQYPQVTFCKVDVDALPSVRNACGITAMPTFQTYSKGKKTGELIGADRGRLEDLVRKASPK